MFSASPKEANSAHLSLSINIKEMKVANSWGAGGPVFPISKKERKENGEVRKGSSSGPGELTSMAGQ